MGKLRKSSANVIFLKHLRFNEQTLEILKLPAYVRLPKSNLRLKIFALHVEAKKEIAIVIEASGSRGFHSPPDSIRLDYRSYQNSFVNRYLHSLGRRKSNFQFCYREPIRFLLSVSLRLPDVGFPIIQLGLLMARKTFSPSRGGMLFCYLHNEIILFSVDS